MAELIIPPSLREAHRRGLAHYLATGECTMLGKRIELPALRADGTEFPVELAITRTFSDGPPMFTGHVRDITERKRAEEEIQRHNRELASLNAITAAVSSSLELSEVLVAFKQRLAEELDVPGGAIFFRDEVNDQFYLEDSWGLPPAVLAALHTFPVTAYLNETMIPGKETVLLQDLREAAPFLAGGLHVAQPGWHNCLWVPLLAQGEIQGIVALLGPASTPFHDDQFVFFQALGQQVGVAIQNARLFEQVSAGRQQLQTLSHRLVELQENERRDVARELHDEIGQLLTGLKLALEMACRSPGAMGSAPPADALTLVNELIARVRRMSLDLRPAMLDDLGLLPALLWHLERYTALTQVGVTFEHAGVQGRLPPAVETAAYRIVQEALTNVARHAGVTEARVRLRVQQGTLRVQIEDRGRGFDTRATLAGGASSGLTGMRERARLLGGQLRVGSAPGEGTRLTAELPLDEPQERQGSVRARTGARDPPRAVGT
jgi:signal transduction histidine kinase